jgi:hypothetical protein
MSQARIYYVPPANVCDMEPSPGWYVIDDEIGLDEPSGPYGSHDDAKVAHADLYDQAAERDWERRTGAR